MAKIMTAMIFQAFRNDERCQRPHTHTCVDEKTYIAKPIATMSVECSKGGPCQLLIDYTCQMFMIE